MGKRVLYLIGASSSAIENGEDRERVRIWIDEKLNQYVKRQSLHMEERAMVANEARIDCLLEMRFCLIK